MSTTHIFSFPLFAVRFWWNFYTQLSTVKRFDFFVLTLRDLWRHQWWRHHSPWVSTTHIFSFLLSTVRFSWNFVLHTGEYGQNAPIFITSSISAPLKPLPEHMLKVCGCGGRCDRKTCKCSVASVPCTVFCHGKSLNMNCMNTIKHSWQVQCLNLQSSIIMSQSEVKNTLRSVIVDLIIMITLMCIQVFKLVYSSLCIQAVVCCCF